MPFIAIHKETGKRVDITDIKQPKLKIKSGDCLCQLCSEPLILKSGFIRATHFCHYKNCDSDYISHPESKEHLEGKRYLYDMLCKIYKPYFDTSLIELEKKVPEAGRVADIMVTFPMGWRVAYELQISPITTKSLEERTNSYGKNGIDTIWIFGGKADTETNRDWSITRFGFYYVLQIYKEVPPYTECKV